MEDWISAHEAMQMLCPRSHEAAARWAEVIVRRVGHEMIPIRAKVFILAGERQIGDDPLVDGQLFRAYNLEQNWVTGDFSAQPNPLAKKAIGFQAFGTQFRRSDIEALVPKGGILSFPKGEEANSLPVDEPSPISEGKPKSNRGRKPNQEAWATFAAAFAVVSSKDDIDPHASAASIYEAIASYMNNDLDESIFSEETARNAITLAQQWKQGIRRNNPK